MTFVNSGYARILKAAAICVLPALGAQSMGAMVADDLGPAPDVHEVRCVAISPDCHRIAVVSSGENGVELLVDAKLVTKAYSIPFVLFSPDSAHIADIECNDGKSFVRLDGDVGDAYDEILADSMRFSADGKRLAYAARKGSDWFTVLDGKPRPTGKSMPSQESFSPDGKHFLFVCKTETGMAVDQDGILTESCVDVRDIVFSRTGPHWAWAAEAQDGKWKAYVDGRAVGDGFDQIDELSLNSDGSRYVYVARTSQMGGLGMPGQFTVVVDGKRNGPYFAVTASPAFTPDGMHLVYFVATIFRNEPEPIASELGPYPFVFALRGVRDGQEFNPHGAVRQFVFSHDGEMAMLVNFLQHFNVGTVSPALVANVDFNGDLEPARDCIGNLVVSPDGRYVAYSSLSSFKGDWITDRSDDGGTQPLAFRQVGPPIFSANSRHLAYAALQGAKGTWAMVLDHTEDGSGALVFPSVTGKSSGERELVPRFKPGDIPDGSGFFVGQIPYHFDPGGTLVYFRIADGHLYRVHWKPDDAATQPASRP
jgi:hypothetical protein